jgi:hypothetical protein
LLLGSSGGMARSVSSLKFTGTGARRISSTGQCASIISFNLARSSWVHLHFATQWALGADRKHVADDQHPNHELRIDSTVDQSLDRTAQERSRTLPIPDRREQPRHRRGAAIRPQRADFVATQLGNKPTWHIGNSAFGAALQIAEE